MSSRCGSADVLEATGVNLELDAAALGAIYDDVGIAFLFAPRLHPAMKAVMPVRRVLGVRTVFNLLGPLTNPAGVGRQVVGVWGREVQDVMAHALAELGAVHAMVVHSDDGLDEFSVVAPTRVIEVRDGRVVEVTSVDPVALVFRPMTRRGSGVAMWRSTRDVLKRCSADRNARLPPNQWLSTPPRPWSSVGQPRRLRMDSKGPGTSSVRERD